MRYLLIFLLVSIAGCKRNDVHETPTPKTDTLKVVNPHIEPKLDSIVKKLKTTAADLQRKIDSCQENMRQTKTELYLTSPTGDENQKERAEKSERFERATAYYKENFEKANQLEIQKVKVETEILKYAGTLDSELK